MREARVTLAVLLNVLDQGLGSLTRQTKLLGEGLHKEGKLLGRHSTPSKHHLS